MEPNSLLTKTPQLVFVYGTLKVGFGNWNRYLNTEDVKFIGKTSINGVLIHLGGIPGLRHDPLCRVVGEVHEVTWEKIAELDLLEGTPTLYTRSQVKTPLGTCWTYYWTRDKDKPLLATAQVVAEGVWRGGKNDMTLYKDLLAWFANRTSQTVSSATNTPPAHIAPMGVPAKLPVALLANSTPAVRVPSEPIVGPGFEEM